MTSLIPGETTKTRSAAAEEAPRSRLTWSLALCSATATGVFVCTARPEASSFVVLAIAVIAHLVLVLVPSIAAALHARAVFGLGAALIAVAVCAQPMGTDLWAYQMYGRIVVEHHENPYLLTPSEFPDDPVLRYMGTPWSGVRAEYGPVLVATAAAVAAVTGTSELRGRLAWQGLCGAAVFATMVLIWRRTKNPAAVAAIGLNPIALYELVHLAHNDALIGLAVTGATVAARKDRQVVAALLLTTGALIKAPVGLALVALLIWVLIRRGLPSAVRAAAAAALFAVAAILAAGGSEVVEPMLGARGRTNAFTLWNLVRGGADIFTGNGSHELPFIAGSTLATAAMALAVVFAVGLTVIRSWRPTRAEWSDTQPADWPDPSPVVFAALLSWLLLSLYTSPWSFGWILPLAAMTWPARHARAVLAFASLFGLAALWGIVTIAAKWLEQPTFPAFDDFSAVGKSLVAAGALALIGSLTIDAARRLSRGRDYGPHPTAVEAGAAYTENVAARPTSVSEPKPA